jgi:hypothetical protein
MKTKSKIAALSLAVKDFERQSGFAAINYRGLLRGATLEEKAEAARRDAKWLEHNANDAISVLRWTINGLLDE